MLARFDEPEPFVDAAGDLDEDVSRIGVLQFGRLFAGVAEMFPKGGKRRRKRINVVVSIGRRKLIFVERRAPGDRLRRSLIGRVPLLVDILLFLYVEIVLFRASLIS